MPERQSSPGEVTARPETDGSTNGGAGRPDGGSAANGSAVGGSPPARPEPAPDPVAEQVAEQVAAEPSAAEPAAAEPRDEAPSGDEPAMTADRAVAIAEDGPAAEPSGAAADPGTPTLGAADLPEPPPADRPAASPRPRPRPAPAGEKPAAEGPARTPVATPSAESPTRPTPHPGPTDPTAEPPAAESPTVAVPVPPTPTAGPQPGPASPQPPSPQPVSPQPVSSQPVSSPPASPSPAAPPWQRSVDAETTQVMALGATSVQAGSGAPAGEPPTERIPLSAVAPPPTPPDGSETVSTDRPRRRLPLLVGAAVVALLALLYVGDLLLSSGSVPRGVTVAGVPVGGLNLVDAEQELRAAIEPRSTRPVEVTVGEVSTQIDPTTAGLAVDWAGTLARAGEQPLNPITRITSLFTQREIGVATTVDREALGPAIAELGPIVDRLPAEGTVRFEGTTPVPVDPVPGQQLDQQAAIGVLEREWASGVPVALPLTPLPPLTTAADVAAAIDEVAVPAVSAPITVIGEGDARGTLEPATIAEALTFEPGDDGGLTPVLNPTVITDALTDQLAGSESEPVDARLDFSTSPPSVVPSQDGRGVDYEATLTDLLTVLTGTGPREITAVYADQPAELTSADLESLGQASVIGEFTTGGFARDSGQNIRRAAELINGIVVEPGETFSLDAATGPRTAANGYIEAGVIDDGRPGRGIAGGVSQVSTTLYNAAYFAGMTDIEHRAHSFYISRYPAGREATIATGAIDNRFRNDNPTAVLIQTEWTPSSVTVRLLGTRRFEVTGAFGPRTNPTSPNTVTIPPGEPCSPSQGSGGFTITDTRTLRDVNTGEVRTETETTRYNPSPIVVCEG
ncbi:VanW family protein [Pseudonocardia sp.]|uniref:VanW family protein n=1 Tax=Pseudonocardia sp. TaxID=60912 RepID=UPI00260B4978|nr:VanW family protein [Pseudonocardia sp.]